MPVAVIPMAEEFGWSMMDRGLVVSAFAWGYIVSQLPSGWASTQVPPFGLLFGAVLSWSACTVLTPAAARMGLRSAMLCRAAMGLAEGFCLPAAFQFVTLTVPPRFRSRAFSLVLGCGAVGQVVALLVCPSMTPSETFTVFGSAGVLWCAVCLVASALSWSSFTAAGRGYGERDDWKAMGDSDPRQEEVSTSEGEALWWRMITCRPLHAICAAHFGQNWTNYTLSSWLPSYLHEVLGMPLQSLSFAALPMVASSIGGIGAGYVADHVTSRRLCGILYVRRAATVLGLGGPALCHAAFVAAGSPQAAVAVATLSFLCGSATGSGYMANHADISATSAGLTFSVANFLATIPGLVAGPLTAALVESSGGRWAPVFLLAAAINVACAAAYVAFSRAHRVL